MFQFGGQWLSYLKEIKIPMGILCVFLCVVTGYNIWHDAQQYKRQQNNLNGICEKTGTNLYQILGAESFFNLSQINWLETERKHLKAHSEKHWEICAERHCGLYLLSDDAESFAALINTYKQRFIETAYPRYQDGKLENNPEKILLEMVKEKIDLTQPIIKMKEGIFFSQFYQWGYVTVISKYKEGELYTFSEMSQKNLLNPRSYITPIEEQRKNGIGNFFIRIQKFYGYPLMDEVVQGIDEYMGVLSNCGERDMQWPDTP